MGNKLSIWFCISFSMLVNKQKIEALPQTVMTMTLCEWLWLSDVGGGSDSGLVCVMLTLSRGLRKRRVLNFEVWPNVWRCPNIIVVIIIIHNKMHGIISPLFLCTQFIFILKRGGSTCYKWKSCTQNQINDFDCHYQFIMQKYANGIAIFNNLVHQHFTNIFNLTTD